MSEMMVWWLAGLTVLVVVLAAVCVALARRLQQQRDAAAEATATLAAQLSAGQEQQQRELLAMGQRVIEADRLVRRFSERLESLEGSPYVERHYGQLDPSVSGAAQREELGTASAAEEQLRSLLRRNTGDS